MTTLSQEADVLAWFRRRRVVDEVDFPRARQLSALTEIARLYERRGLLRAGQALPLWEACERCNRCWAGAEPLRPGIEHERSGVSLPWVGPNYEVGLGVAAIGMNLRDAGGLLTEYEISARSGGAGSQTSCLEMGQKTAHGSPWAYGSLRSSGAVADWLAGQPIRDRTDPKELVAVLEQTARLQAVKCSPDDGARSTPTPAMVAECPSFLLSDELERLRPAAVVGFGLDVYDALGRLGAIADGGDYLAWGRFETRGRQIPVFWLYHPSGRYWSHSHAALLAHLDLTPADDA
jgi:hypothetical protein